MWDGREDGKGNNEREEGELGAKAEGRFVTREPNPILVSHQCLLSLSRIYTPLHSVSLRNIRRSIFYGCISGHQSGKGIQLGVFFFEGSDVS